MLYDIKRKINKISALSNRIKIIIYRTPNNKVKC